MGESSAPRGYLCLALHAHLPYVRHPEHEDFLEEGWLYEAILETYIPLLWVLEGLAADGIDHRLTMSMSPPLVSMLNDELLRRRFARRLDLLCELSEKEVRRTRGNRAFRDTARMYRDRFRTARRDYQDRWHGDLVGAFRRLQDHGSLEILTCGATHGYLPLLRIHPQAVRAQILVAAQHYRETFGRSPRGVWLPECGYYPGLDDVLRDAGLGYFFLDTHGIAHAESRPALGTYAPLYCPSGVAAFGRDPDSSKQVWSSVEGYPGDPDYREYYRDIGFDLDADYLRPYIHPDGLRTNTGIKYHRITHRGPEKEPYVRARALEKAALHAGHFLSERRRVADQLGPRLGRPPLMVATYDAELFGHWWFEGPDWIDSLFRTMATEAEGVHPVTAPEYLDLHPVNQVDVPAASSWGDKGYSEVWLNGANDWIYRHLHEAADRMIELADRFPHAQDVQKRALNQAARELLLAQSSDWAFIMKANTTVPYAVRRTQDHLKNFAALYGGLRQGRLPERQLAGMEMQNNIFPGIDYRVFRTGQDRNPA